MIASESFGRNLHPCSPSSVQPQEHYRYSGGGTSVYFPDIPPVGAAVGLLIMSCLSCLPARGALNGP